MRKPSENLSRQISQLNLCTHQQLMACEKQVDRLSDGLPDFDSVWLDVLVQRQVISRFQADYLQQGKQATLRLGSLTLREQLGQRSYLAMADSNQPVVIQERKISSDVELNRLTAQIESLHSNRQSAPASLAVPIRLVTSDSDESDPHLFVATQFHPGWTVAELLVRGGRLPWQSVLSICQNTLTALQWLHSQGCCHGNVNSNNVRITPDGKVVLVGALGSRFPDGGISLSANLKYDEARFLAPERTLNLQPANFQSDLYSLAAVLWNLLAARDAFLTTDPIGRITKAGKENLPDIRTLVPSCPSEFALAIQRFSKSNPQLRPADPAQAIELIRATGQGNRQTLRSMVRTLPDRLAVKTPLKAAASRSSQIATLAVACLMVLAFTLFGIKRGLIPSVASLTAPTATEMANTKAAVNQQITTNVSQTNQQSSSADPNRIRMLPSPDVAGVVVLQSGITYHASDLSFPGVMHIETSGNESTKIVVSADQSWNLIANQIALSNVHVVHQQQKQIPSHKTVSNSARDFSSTHIARAVHFQADVVSIRKCVIESSLASQKAVCFHWSGSAGTAARLQVQDCVFRSNGAAISTSLVPESCSLKNCLALVNRCVLIATLPTEISTPWKLTIDQFTQPSGLTFADFLMPENTSRSCEIIMTAGESVLSPSLALVQFAARNSTAATESKIQFSLPERGNAVIVPPAVATAVAWDQSLKSVVALAANKISSDAILSAEPVFRGQASAASSDDFGQWQAFELIDYDGPKLTKQLPGVRVTNLPELTPRQNLTPKMRAAQHL